MKSSCWYLKDLAFFRGLPEEVFASFVAGLTPRKFARREDIFVPSEAVGKVYILKEGEVRLCDISFEGKKIVVDTLRAGDIFGDIAPGTAPLSLFAEATPGTDLCIATKDQFSELLRAHPDLAFELIEAMARRLAEAEEKIKTLALADVRRRLLHELARYGRRHGVETAAEIRLASRLTHQELAEMIGATRETVTHTLNALKREKILREDREHRLILDKKRFEAAF